MPSGPERMECFSSSSTAQPQPVGTRASASSASFVAFARRIAVQTSLDRDRPRSCDAPYPGQSCKIATLIATFILPSHCPSGRESRRSTEGRRGLFLFPTLSPPCEK
jgi:hypothetical protein